MLALGTACAEALLKAFERDRMSMASAGDQLQDNVVGEVAWVTFLFDGRKRLPSPVDWPKMNEGGCTGPENELRRKGLSAACCWMRSSACSGERLDACKFGRASFEVLVSSSCRPIEENS